jgi:hypothetical protein
MQARAATETDPAMIRRSRDVPDIWSDHDFAPDPSSGGNGTDADVGVTTDSRA